jgi:regulator of sigma E protease
MSYILVFFAISMLLLLHEAGHLAAARRVGIPVTRFSIGFGRRLWGFKRNDTEYRVSLLPFGGYVLLDLEDEQAYFALPLRKRVLFALGGPAANILGAFVCLSLINVALYGISLNAIVFDPLRGTWQMAARICAAISVLFNKPDQLSGVVGIVAIGGQHVGMNVVRLLHLCVLLNLNLAVLNLLPIPPLDGGRIVMGILEKICSPLRRVELPLTIAGWVVLIGLMLYATALDISRIAVGTLA